MGIKLFEIDLNFPFDVYGFDVLQESLNAIKTLCQKLRGLVADLLGEAWNAIVLFNKFVFLAAH